VPTDPPPPTNPTTNPPTTLNPTNQPTKKAKPPKALKEAQHANVTWTFNDGKKYSQSDVVTLVKGGVSIDVTFDVYDCARGCFKKRDDLEEDQANTWRATITDAPSTSVYIEADRLAAYLNSKSNVNSDSISVNSYGQSSTDGTLNYNQGIVAAAVLMGIAIFIIIVIVLIFAYFKLQSKGESDDYRLDSGDYKLV
jgi:hypothetical protein